MIFTYMYSHYCVGSPVSDQAWNNLLIASTQNSQLLPKWVFSIDVLLQHVSQQGRKKYKLTKFFVFVL